MTARKETYKINVYPVYIHDFLGPFFKGPNPSPLLILVVSYLPRNPIDIKVYISDTDGNSGRCYDDGGKR